MAVWDQKTTWCFMVLLAGAVGQSVNYLDPGCAVKGSTVTLPCTFTPAESFTDKRGQKVLIEIIRVIWCRNHAICHGFTPSVYDSELLNNNPRYRYLGDKKGNCTLQITDVQKEDEGILRFRMEANLRLANFVGSQGVAVAVSDGAQMKTVSTSDRVFKKGEAVTLHCTTMCTFHQLEVNWFRDHHALSESGPTLQLRALAAGDSGNYTCGLKASVSTLSQPYSLYVEAEEEGTNSCTADPLLAVRLLLFTLHTMLIIIVASIVIKRTCVCKKGELKDATVPPPDFVEEL